MHVYFLCVEAQMFLAFNRLLANISNGDTSANRGAAENSNYTQVDFGTDSTTFSQ